VDILDVVIIVFLVVVAFSGLRRGLSGVAFAIAGLIAGLFLGAVIAPLIAKAITQDRNTQRLFAIGIFIATALLVEGIGAAIGFRIRQRTQHSMLLGKADSAVGAALGLVAALATTWYLGLMFSQSPWIGLDNQITNSTIERSLDRFMPRPPGFLATIGNLFLPGNFPNPFSTILDIPQAPVAIPPLVDTAGIREATDVTVKVIASGCDGGAEAGSSWPLAAGYFVTNAHVVAGSGSVEIDPPKGGRYPAKVVLFDPNTDLAILYSPGLDLHPLTLVKANPARGTGGAVIGYPGGGAEQVVAAAVSGTESARGYNIYCDALVTREIEVLSARVIPGNSGGPIVNDSGQIIGVVFAASTTQTNVGYALTIPQVLPDLQAGERRTAAVSTEACAS
jgi:Trypsin-like peptidase domain/Colicin V production protein